MTKLLNFENGTMTPVVRNYLLADYRVLQVQILECQSTPPPPPPEGFLLVHHGKGYCIYEEIEARVPLEARAPGWQKCADKPSILKEVKTSSAPEMTERSERVEGNLFPEETK